MTAPDRVYRSVSQLKQWERCPHSWYLARTLKAWQRPAAWLPQGSAVHTVAEHIELRKLSGNPMTLDEAQDLFREEYAKEVGKYTEITPNLDWWFASGPYRGEQDIERRYEIGLGQVEKFLDWHYAHEDQVIWIAPDGTPGVELAFEMELDGIPVRGFIDAIRVVDGNPRVVDYKTGNQPGDDFQLAVYGIALAELFFEDVELGEYWMGKSGKSTYPYDLTDWTRERVAEKFKELDENIRAERFDPKPDPKTCLFCDVSLACEFRAG